VKAGIDVSLDYKRSTWNLADDAANSQEVWDGCHSRSVQRIVDTALENGGMYIKLGQTFGAMNNVLPEIYTSGLAVLQNKARPQGIVEVEQTFVQEFGRLPYEVFKVFEKHPVGAASLAQVMSLSPFLCFVFPTAPCLTTLPLSLG